MMTDEIIAFDCEITAYRKGCISVHMNLQKGYLAWNESRQWCNNFIRALTEEDICELRNGLRSLETLKDKDIGWTGTDGAGAEKDNQSGHGAQLTLFWPGCQLVFSSEELGRENWQAMHRMIEKLSRVPFKL